MVAACCSRSNLLAICYAPNNRHDAHPELWDGPATFLNCRGPHSTSPRCSSPRHLLVRRSLVHANKSHRTHSHFSSTDLQSNYKKFRSKFDLVSRVLSIALLRCSNVHLPPDAHVEFSTLWFRDALSAPYCVYFRRKSWGPYCPYCLRWFQHYSPSILHLFPPFGTAVSNGQHLFPLKKINRAITTKPLRYPTIRLNWRPLKKPARATGTSKRTDMCLRLGTVVRRLQIKTRALSFIRSRIRLPSLGFSRFSWRGTSSSECWIRLQSYRRPT